VVYCLHAGGHRSGARCHRWQRQVEGMCWEFGKPCPFVADALPATARSHGMARYPHAAPRRRPCRLLVSIYTSPPLLPRSPHITREPRASRSTTPH
jgi:hypothetical protein